MRRKKTAPKSTKLASSSGDKKSAAWLATLEAISPAAIYRADANGNCIWVNRKWSELTGIPAAAAKGNGWERAIHPEDRVRIVDEWRRTFSEGHVFCSEYRYQKPDSSVVWVFCRVAEERDGKGRATGYIGMVVDVTELRQAHATIQRFGDGDGGAHELTKRERDVARLLGDGRSNKQIASDLGLSVRTIEAHRARIMRKLRIHSLADLVKYAIRRGLVRQD